MARRGRQAAQGGARRVAGARRRQVVGAVYRADVEQYMEGMEVLSVIPPKTASPAGPAQRAPRADPGGPVGARRRRHLRAQGPLARAATATAARAGARRRPRASEGDAERPRRDRPERPRADRPPRGRGDADRAPRERQPRPEGADEARGPRPDGAAERRGPRPEGAGDRRGPRPPRPERPGRPARPLHPPVTTTHRNAFLATLSPEQLPVAEQLLRGGMPAVRTAVAEQNRNAAAQGRPTVDAVTIERIASRPGRARQPGHLEGPGRRGRLRRQGAAPARPARRRHLGQDRQPRRRLARPAQGAPGRADDAPRRAAHRVDGQARGGHRRAQRRRGAAPRGAPARHLDARQRRVAARVVTLASDALTAEQDPATWRTIVDGGGRHVDPAQREAPRHPRRRREPRRRAGATPGPSPSSPSSWG